MDPCHLGVGGLAAKYRVRSGGMPAMLSQYTAYLCSVIPQSPFHSNLQKILIYIIHYFKNYFMLCIFFDAVGEKNIGNVIYIKSQDWLGNTRLSHSCSVGERCVSESL